LALKHAKKDWFWIGVHGNMFESICSALWQFRNEKRAVLTGLIWDNEWTNLTFIDNEGTNAGGHSIAIIGYEKQLNGKDYLVIQNSIGKEIGDEGIQYLSRDLINRNLQFGALMFVDAEDITEEQILKKSAYYRANFLKKLYLLFIKWLFAE
jgi:C1A family cysteine protease